MKGFPFTLVYLPLIAYIYGKGEMCEVCKVATFFFQGSISFGKHIFMKSMEALNRI